MRRRPASGEDLITLLRQRHATLLGGRPDTRPGELKQTRTGPVPRCLSRPASCGEHCSPDSSAIVQLTDPFHRAAFVMFLVAEVHPFDDGNGRIARLMMNADLVAADQTRIVIPDGLPQQLPDGAARTHAQRQRRELHRHARLRPALHRTARLHDHRQRPPRPRADQRVRRLGRRRTHRGVRLALPARAS